MYDIAIWCCMTLLFTDVIIHVCIDVGCMYPSYA